MAASTLDGLLYGAGDAVIGLNPASDSMPVLGRLLHMLDEVIQRFEIPTQSCVLTHVTNTLKLAEAGAPVDLVELVGRRLGLRGAAFLPQQGLAQAPGAVGVAVLFEGVGVGQHPQKVVPVLAQARRVVTVEGPLGPG